MLLCKSVLLHGAACHGKLKHVGRQHHFEEGLLLTLPLSRLYSDPQMKTDLCAIVCACAVDAVQHTP